PLSPSTVTTTSCSSAALLDSAGGLVSSPSVDGVCDDAWALDGSSEEPASSPSVPHAARARHSTAVARPAPQRETAPGRDDWLVLMGAIVAARARLADRLADPGVG